MYLFIYNIEPNSVIDKFKLKKNIYLTIIYFIFRNTTYIHSILCSRVIFTLERHVLFKNINFISPFLKFFIFSISINIIIIIISTFSPCWIKCDFILTIIYMKNHRVDVSLAPDVRKIIPKTSQPATATTTTTTHLHILISTLQHTRNAHVRYYLPGSNFPKCIGNRFVSTSPSSYERDIITACK